MTNELLQGRLPGISLDVKNLAEVFTAAITALGIYPLA